MRLVHADLIGMTSGQLLQEAARVLVRYGRAAGWETRRAEGW